MSWQCPTCETVNQDVTPVCTVCENLAPVIDSYLSLEAIERITDYNEKLDIIHTYEREGNYREMLNASIEALSLYKENSLAMNKAKLALIYLQHQDLKEKVFSLLDTAIEKRDYNMASAVLKIASSLEISSEALEHKKTDVKLNMSRKKEVDLLLDNSFYAMIKLDTSQALHIVEEGMIKHSNSKRLRQRREEIQGFITILNEAIEKKDQKKRSFPQTSIVRKKDNDEIYDDKGTNTTQEYSSKRKFPKIKRT